ncbi:MAG TPA: c-type cytochrome [Phycisphaerae bacterium]|nr:c-type cytochrome [Phycisphaerae bacterium]
MSSPCLKEERLAFTLAIVVAGCGAALSCKREERDYGATASEVEVSSSIPLTDLIPGPSPATSPGTQPVVISVKSFHDNYQNNAFAISQGQQLIEHYNCNTCHAHGGGDIGPPLIDDTWIYGYQPNQIFATIVQGRPNGMPAFGSRLNEQQVWQLTAYVRSMSGMASKNAAPARQDHMQTKPPENSMPAPQSKTSGSTPSGERPE